MPRDLHTLRNIGIIAHIDAGKTTVTERMLYYSGAKHRVGEVDKGTTETDSDPEEQDRGITIYAACVTFPWKDVIVNLIDTPGHVDFTAEVERSLRVLDGAVVVFSAREGVEAQSETVWRQADRYRVPRVAFINKMDREGADFEDVLAEMVKRLQANPVPVQIPVGQGPPHVADPFRGVIDLIEMTYRTFGGDRQSKDIVDQEIPAELRPRAEKWRHAMLEKLYDYSNELMELALQEEPIPVPLIRRVLREATIHMQLQPVLCGSALHGIGVQPVLDGVQHYLPSPLDVPPVEGRGLAKTKDGEAPVERRKPSPSEPFCGLVFKVLPAKTGDMFWVRIYSGVLKANSRALNPGKDVKENISQLWHIHATKKEEQVEAAEAGDIVGLVGMRHSITGDTLCDTKHPILLESIEFPETVISMAIEPETSADRKKLADALDMLKRQDPTFRALESAETGQTLISGMGELHLEVIKHRLLRDFKLNVRVHKPRVSYRETVARTSEVTGECNQTVSGQALFARVRLRLEPLEGDKPVTVGNSPDVALAPALLTAVLDTLTQQAEGGGSLGFPLLRVRLTVTGAESRDIESTEIAFRRAAADAFHKALTESGIVLLEPIMKLDIITPEEYMGDFVSDLQQRRATIRQTQPRGRNTQIEAEAPLANLFGYSGAMRGLSQGRASCSMTPSHYGPAPPEVLQSFV